MAPGLNGSDLMRSLALHGVNCFGMRICGAAELARLALMRSGISIAGIITRYFENLLQCYEILTKPKYYDIRVKSPDSPASWLAGGGEAL